MQWAYVCRPQEPSPLLISHTPEWPESNKHERRTRPRCHQWQMRHYGHVKTEHNHTGYIVCQMGHCGVAHLIILSYVTPSDPIVPIASWIVPQTNKALRNLDTLNRYSILQGFLFYSHSKNNTLFTTLYTLIHTCLWHWILFTRIIVLNNSPVGALCWLD